MKVQSIVLVIIILLLLYIVIRYVFADVNTMSGLMSGTTEQIISPSTLATPSGLYASNFAYNIWFYIDNYNYKSGDEKILLVRTDAGMTGTNSITQLNPFPAITFDANTNNMSVYVSNSSGSVGAIDTKCSNSAGTVGTNGTGEANGKSANCCSATYNPTNAAAATVLINTGYAGYILDPNGPGPGFNAVGTYTANSVISGSAAAAAAGSGNVLTGSQVDAATIGWWQIDSVNTKVKPAIKTDGSYFGNGCASSGHYKRYPDIANPLAGDADYPYTYTYGASLGGYPLDKYGNPIKPTATDGSFSQYDLNASYHNDKISVSNIPVQSWTMVTVNINQLNVEVYINGKLQTTGKLAYIANPSATAPVYITPNGGFAGWTSKFGYYPNSLNPQDIWNLYQNGYGGSWLSNLFGSYNVKISLIENGNPSSSVTI